MQLIHYADGSVLTGSTIALALVDYAQILASNGSAAAVQVPTRQDDGSVGRATFLLGPASQIVAVDTASEFAELEDAELVAFLESETEKQRGAAVRPEEQSSDIVPDDLEWNE